MPVLASNYLPKRPNGLIFCPGEYCCLDGSYLENLTTIVYTANLAFYIPFELHYPETIKQIGYENGSTSTGNFDVGIYDFAGNRIISSGSTAKSGTATLQKADITDTTLGVGRYYLAFAQNGTEQVSVVNISSGSLWTRLMGIRTQSTAFTLPSTATFANPSVSYYPILVMFLQATG